MVGQLRNVQQTFEFRFQFDEDTKVGDLGDRPFDDRVDLVAAWDIVFPGVLRKLLQTESDTLTVFVN